MTTQNQGQSSGGRDFPKTCQRSSEIIVNKAGAGHHELKYPSHRTSMGKNRKLLLVDNVLWMIHSSRKALFMTIMQHGSITDVRLKRESFRDARCCRKVFAKQAPAYPLNTGSRRRVPEKIHPFTYRRLQFCSPPYDRITASVYFDSRPHGRTATKEIGIRKVLGARSCLVG